MATTDGNEPVPPPFVYGQCKKFEVADLRQERRREARLGGLG